MSYSESIRVLLVADEALARQNLREVIETQPEMKIVGECVNGIELVTLIKEQPVDLLILDVEMPEANGLAALEIIPAEQLPLVIFITSNERYAVRAFDFNAVDFVLKPFERERFEKALLRARKQLLNDSSQILERQMFFILRAIKAKSEYAERFIVKSNGHMFFIKTDDIDWIEAEGNYVSLHSGKDSHLLRDTISALESQLDPKKFMRVHRSTIVNLDCVKELQSWFHGDYRIILRNGKELMLSRSYRDRLSGLFGKEL
jgi:two-component system, LytTR family, response regulator